MDRTILTAIYASPVGELILGSWQGRLCLCDWTASPRCFPELRRLAARLDASIVDCADDVTRRAARQLDEYFAGRRREFDIPLEITGTDFQRAVRHLLCRIPFGNTLSYSALSALAGRPSAVRAVAGALASNPLSIFVPCHRVTAAGGRTGGYRGGDEAKRILLAIESR